MALKKMRVADVIPMVEMCLRTDKPILIVGAPGIGKSEVTDQIRVKHGYDLILSHPVVSDPTDAKGFPVTYSQADGTVIADFIPYGDLRYAMTTTRPTLWFLDDLGQAPPSVQAAFMQLLLAREINGKRISPHVRFVACTNDRTHRAGVTGILEPVKGRFAMIVEMVPHIDDFTNWAYTHNIYPTIPAYLRFDNKQLHNFSPTNGMEKSPDPRGWAMLSALLYDADQNGMRDKHSIIAESAVGEGAGSAFAVFERVYGELPDIDNIIKHPDTFVVPSQPDRLYAIISSIARKTTLGNIDNIVKIAQRMKPQIAAIMIHDARAICPDIELSEAFGNYCTSAAPAYIN